MVHNHYPAHLTETVIHRATTAEVAARLNNLNKPFSLVAETESGLLLGRDHLGVESLYYARHPTRGWVAAPTVGEILDLVPDSGSAIDEEAVIAHIDGGSAGPNKSFFSRVHSVEPGTLFSLAPTRSEKIRFWDPAAVPVDHHLEVGEAGARFGSLLVDSVRDHASEAVAATLSSGLDSTSVVTALARADVDTTALVWVTPEVMVSEELAWVRKTAAGLGLPLIELAVAVGDLLPESGIMTRRSTPLFNVFDHLWRVVCGRVAEEGIDSLFTGFGGDHLLGGWIPGAADLLMSMRLRALRRYLERTRPGYGDLGRAFTAEVVTPILEYLFPRISKRRRGPVPWLHPDRQEQWLDLQIVGHHSRQKPGHAGRVSRLTSGTISQLSEDLAAQARPHGVRLHHPLLDRRLVEAVLSIPSWVVDDGERTRVPQRHAVEDSLGHEPIELDEARTEDFALHAMRMRADQLMALSRDMRAADLKFVSEPVLAKRVERFLRGEHDDMSFWNSLTLEDWLRRWW